MGAVRFLLALAVTIAHVGKIPFYSGVGSLTAVQGFYVISGFLIARVWDLKYGRQEQGVRLFYGARAARIYFMYWAVLALALVVAVAVRALGGDWPDYIPADLYVSWQILIYQFVSNVSLAGSSVALWLGAAPDGVLYFTNNFTTSPLAVWRLLILAPAWTLELELWFYLLAPFILRLRLRWIVAIAATSFALRFGWYAFGNDVDPWAYRFFPFELGLFLLGAIAYRSIGQIRVDRRVAMSLYVATVAVLATYVPPFFVEHRFVFLLIFAAVLPVIFELTKDWPVDRFLADMSFPLYLVHWPIMLLALHWPKPLAAWPGMVATLLSIAAAAALVLFVERPIDRWRQARFGRLPRPLQDVPRTMAAAR